MLAEKIYLSIFGFTSGVLVAAGVFAFIVTIGVVTRMAARTKTVKYAMLYEDMAFLGGTLGNILSIFKCSMSFGRLFIGVSGLFAGIYVGCLSLALAESLNAIPVFFRRISLKKGIGLVVIGFAIGKFAGALWQLAF